MLPDDIKSPAEQREFIRRYSLRHSDRSKPGWMQPMDPPPPKPGDPDWPKYQRRIRLERANRHREVVARSRARQAAEEAARANN